MIVWFLLALLLGAVLTMGRLVRGIQLLKAQNAAFEERLHLALEGADEALWDWNIKSNRTFYSDRWSEMLGFTPEEIGASVQIFDELCHPEDLSATTQKLQEHLEGRSDRYEAEFRMRTKAGEWRWIHARGRVVERAADGSAVRIAGTHLNISGQKKADEELQAEQQHLRNLMNGLPDYIYFKDCKSRFLRVNRAMLGFFGVSDVDQIIGKTDFDFFTLEHARQAFSDEQELVAGNQTEVSKEEKETWPDGRESWSFTTKLPLRDKSGNITGIFGISRDITERKQMERELVAAKESAESASRAKSEFLANMSHEIRTPMNGVIGMTELVLDTDLDQEQRDNLTAVRLSAESLLVVINDILDFSKIEAGGLELDPIPFNLKDTLEETMRALALQAHRKGLELACDIGPDVPECVIADPTRMRQILTNLIGNAVKFTDHGEVTLIVRIDKRESDQLFVHFTVKDTGIGIPKGKLEKIFDAFAQADGSTSRRYGGTGLGLTISMRLAKAMSGNIWAESEIGKGSCFHFTACCEPVVLDEEERVPADGACLVGLEVIVVDDNATNRRILTDLLSRWGMKPTPASGGREAIALMQLAADCDHPFRAVVTDVQMPEMDGFEFCALVRGIEHSADAVILMLTSGEQRGDVARRHEVGVAAYLTKPLRRAELHGALIQSLGGSQMRQLESAAASSFGLRPPNSGNATRARILLAEDNSVNERIAVRILEKEGHTIVVARNGLEALQALQTQEFDLVLMDIQMPEMSGFEAAGAIRERERGTGKHIPIIAMTAHAVAGDRERCRGAGMDGYINKPISSRDLVDMVAKYCEPAAARQGVLS